MDHVSAVEFTLLAHRNARRLEDGHGPEVNLYHLLHSLLEWSDARGVDFDATLSEVRADLAEV